MSNIKGIIFDLDGVLISTDKFHYLAWKQLADKLGIPFSEKDNEQLRGVSRMESLELILKNDPRVKLTEEEKIAAATEKNDCYREYLKTMTPDDVSAEVRETLTALHEMGYKLSVGSSSKNARFILSQTDLTRYFDAIADGNDIKNSKPDPEVFALAAKAVGELPENCLAVDDAESGIASAKGAGTVAVGIGNSAERKLGEYNVESLKDLLNLI